MGIKLFDNGLCIPFVHRFITNFVDAKNTTAGAERKKDCHENARNPSMHFSHFVG